MGSDKKRSRSRSRSPDKKKRKRKKRVSKWDKPGPAGTVNVAGSLGQVGSMPGMPGLNPRMGFGALGASMGMPMINQIAVTPMEPPLIDRSEELEKMREKLMDVNRKAARGYVEIPEEERSPSPPPVYDELGKRMNTREMRFQDSVELERASLMNRLLKIAVYKHPVLLNLVVRVKESARALEKRIYIPYDKYPDYNFAGVIIGPRGVNQQKLETESGCSISLRGKGTRKRRDGKYCPGEDLPQHVYIKAPSAEALAKGIEVVERALIPQSDEERRAQMREIAIMNGTLVVAKPCFICGQTTHKPQLCPNKLRYSAGVKCLVCGDTSHVAKDCPQRNGQGDKNLQDELGRFMREINADLGLPGQEKTSNITPDSKLTPANTADTAPESTNPNPTPAPFKPARPAMPSDGSAPLIVTRFGHRAKIRPMPGVPGYNPGAVGAAAPNTPASGQALWNRILGVPQAGVGVPPQGVPPQGYGAAMPMNSMLPPSVNMALQQANAAAPAAAAAAAAPGGPAMPPLPSEPNQAPPPAPPLPENGAPPQAQPPAPPVDPLDPAPPIPNPTPTQTTPGSTTDATATPGTDAAAAAAAAGRGQAMQAMMGGMMMGRVAMGRGMAMQQPGMAMQQPGMAVGMGRGMMGAMNPYAMQQQYMGYQPPINYYQQQQYQQQQQMRYQQQQQMQYQQQVQAQSLQPQQQAAAATTQQQQMVGSYHLTPQDLQR